MKISELSELTGVTKTRIHYYTREGMLPPPVKRHHNTGTYSKKHIRRLDLILKLRAKGLSIGPIKRILELLEEGVPLDTAISLQQAVYNRAKKSKPLTAKEFREKSGFTEESINELEGFGLLPMLSIDGYSELDLTMVDAVKEFSLAGIEPNELKSISHLIQEISRIEFNLSQKLVAGKTPSERSKIFSHLQNASNQMHEYLFTRFRQREVFKSIQNQEDTK